MKTYGELDGEISYQYATAFAKVGQSLTSEEKTQLMGLRVQLLGGLTKPTGAYLYSQPISMPDIPNTDFLFGTSGGSSSNPIAPSFSDISSSPYEQAIEEMASKGAITGYPDGTFRPDATLTRMQFAKMIVKTLGYPVPLATPARSLTCPRALTRAILSARPTTSPSVPLTESRWVRHSPRSRRTGTSRGSNSSPWWLEQPVFPTRRRRTPPPFRPASSLRVSTTSVPRRPPMPGFSKAWRERGPVMSFPPSPPEANAHRYSGISGSKASRLTFPRGR